MKYKLLDDDTLTLRDGTILRRIRALIDIPASGLRPLVKAGDLGGYLEDFGNLDADEDNVAWVGSGAWCWGRACVFERAQMLGNSRAWDDVHLFGSAVLSDYAVAFEMANLSQQCHVYGRARIYGEARIGGLARVYEGAVIGERAVIAGDAHVFGEVVVAGRAHIGGQARLGGTQVILGDRVIMDADGGDKYPR